MLIKVKNKRLSKISIWKFIKRHAVESTVEASDLMIVKSGEGNISS